MLLEVVEEMLTLIGGLIVAYFVYVLITRKDDKPTEDPPTMAHAALRDIVERAVEDARKLPGLGTSGSKEGTQEGRNIAEHSYEDLLATAILNKVIEKFQREQVDGNSNVLLDKPAQITKCTLSENEIGLDERVEEGCSSLEPLSHNDCSSECNASCLRHVRNQPERLSLTIEERIEEVTTTYTSDEEHREHDVLAIKNTHRVPFPELGMDIIDPSQDSSEDSLDEVDTPTAHVDLISPIESWEENWLFQKKRVQVQADSVAMLVPNSSADYKALIGDKDAEDTSDLSECSSAMSDEEIEKELREAISNVVPRSPKKTEFDVENALDIATETSDGSRAKDEVASDFRTELPASYTKGLPINALEKQNMDEKKAEGTGKTELKTSNETSAKLENGIRTSSSSENRRAGMENGSESNVNESNTSSSKGSSCVVAENKAKEIEVKSVQRESKSVKIESPDVPIANASNNVPEFTEPKGTLSVENYVGIDDVEPEKTDKEFETIFKEVVGENGVNLIDLKKEPIDAPIKEDSCLQKSATTAENSIGPSSIPLLDENVACDAPKTPACTPTRTSLTEDNVENVDDAENFIADNATVLNSLECAKKKLMVVDDNSVESLRDEETKPMMQKVDFNAEDAQQESEYTEHYDTATQRHLDSLTKIETSSKENELIMETFDQETTLGNSILIKEETKCREAVAFAKAESASYMSLQNVKSAEEVQLTAPPRPGTIAEREHKKWENAPPIENNPYSEESIQKRLWQRQYSRRLSDIPGIHSELPKSNGTDLEVILTPQEPDIKRFSRDYYINNAKAASGDKGRRSTTSISSRPSSSLSQRSNSTGADQEQQVSFELEKFEEASLRGSLSRWSYLDPQSSPHFAINPLLRLDLGETSVSADTARLYEGNSHAYGDKANSILKRSMESDEVGRRDLGATGGKAEEVPTKRRIIDENFVLLDGGGKTARGSELTREKDVHTRCGTECWRMNDEDISEIATDTWSQSNDVESTSGSFEYHENLTFIAQSDKDSLNPLFEAEQIFLQPPERSNPDRDSGMYSIESNDLEMTKDKDQNQDCWTGLMWMNGDKYSHSEAKENQILSINGRRYWNTGGYKYNTFGGIRKLSEPIIDDPEEDNPRDEISDEFPLFHTAEFSNLKFQTFGGIKRSGKIDGKGIPTYRKIKLRPSLQTFKRHREKSKPSEDGANLRSREISADAKDYTENVTMKRKLGLDVLSFEDDDWQDEDCNNETSSDLKETSRSWRSRSLLSKNFSTSPRIKRKSCRSCKRHFKTISSSSCQSSDDWEDEDMYGTDEAIMSTFLNDASKRGMSGSSYDNLSSSSVNVSRKKRFHSHVNSRRARSTGKRRSSDEKESLKLEPPIVPKVVERTFETLRDMRNSERAKKKRKESPTNKKFGVRSLSDVTIW